MKNKFLNSLLNLFKSGCVIFTFVVFAFYILGNVLASATQVLTLKNLFLLLLFSIWFAASNQLLKSNKMNIILRVALHFVSTVLGFFVVFVYLPGNLENSSGAFVLTLGFIGLYALVAAVILGIRTAVTKEKKDKEEYKSVYEKSKED